MGIVQRTHILDRVSRIELATLSEHLTHSLGLMTELP